MDRDILTTMPIWIRLPELNLKLWDKEAFDAIASVVGNPLKLDEPTAKETRLSYARILVEINANTELPKEAIIKMQSGFGSVTAEFFVFYDSNVIFVVISVSSIGVGVSVVSFDVSPSCNIENEL